MQSQTTANMIGQCASHIRYYINF